MSGRRLRLRLRPRSVRGRLTLVYSALFLGAGAALLGATYGLVASSLPAPSPAALLDKTARAKLAAQCKFEATSTTTPAGKAIPQALPAECQSLYLQGAQAESSAQRSRTLDALLLYSLVALGAMTLFSGGLGWLMAGRALRPVGRITAAARRASERHLGERISLGGPLDEVRRLADTFDEMLDRLDAAFVSQKRFVADASHELRTPLTVMRTAIDVALASPQKSVEQMETMAERVRRAVEQADALVDALLTLATSERPVVAGEPTDLAVTVEDALDGLAAPIAALGLRISPSLSPALVVGDPVLVERLVGNLVENAVRHNSAGGFVSVRTSAASPSGATLEVANSGPTLTAEFVGSMFEPFRRAEVRTSTRDGVGLGLAIVRSIAEAHSATVEARAREEGGLEVRVTFPGPDDSARDWVQISSP